MSSGSWYLDSSSDGGVAPTYVVSSVSAYDGYRLCQVDTPAYEWTTFVVVVLCVCIVMAFFMTTNAILLQKRKND